MIDFETTHADKGKVNFCNDYSDVLKSYDYNEFEQWVKRNHEIPIPESDFEPNRIHKEWYGRFDAWCLNEYIEDNWIEVTKDFYNAMNKAEFKANNTAQQNRYPFGIQGCYDTKPASRI